MHCFPHTRKIRAQIISGQEQRHRSSGQCSFFGLFPYIIQGYSPQRIPGKIIDRSHNDIQKTSGKQYAKHSDPEQYHHVKIAVLFLCPDQSDRGIEHCRRKKDCQQAEHDPDRPLLCYGRRIQSHRPKKRYKRSSDPFYRIFGISGRRVSVYIMVRRLQDQFDKEKSGCVGDRISQTFAAPQDLLSDKFLILPKNDQLPQGFYTA